MSNIHGPRAASSGVRIWIKLLGVRIMRQQLEKHRENATCVLSLG
jgi:hypothetical protein